MKTPREKVRSIINQMVFLTQEEKNFIVDETIIESYQKGTILLKQGQIPTKCFMVVEGCVREFTNCQGVEKTTQFYMENQKITPLAHDGNEVPSIHTLECLEDCIITVSDPGFEHKLFKRIPRLREVATSIGLEEFKKAKAEWTRFSTSTPEERYLHLMEVNPALFNRVAHHHIASYLGMQPQSLSRIRRRVIDKQRLLDGKKRYVVK